MFTTEEMCNHLIPLLHAPIRWYDSEGVQRVQHQHFDQPQDPLIQDPDLEKLLLGKATEQYPVLYFEFDSVIYGIIQSPQDGIFILGPCSLGLDSRKTAAKLCQEHHLTSHYRISYCSLETFASVCSMLFHHCTGINLSWNEIITLNACADMLETSVEKELNRLFFSYQEQGKVHNPYEQEQREQNSIRNGDLEGLKRSFEETYVGEVGIVAKNPLRHAKNIAITLVALASRSAIEGGIAPEMAYSLSDSYILQIEETSQPSEAVLLARKAEIHYTKLVAEHKKELEKSSLISRCKLLVKQHICEKIRVGNLARQLGVNPNYLSGKFYKEEGISLVSYINNEKIAFAKQRLRFTRDDYGTIAYTLGFSSQSHFTNVFKKATGLTPKQYRDQFNSD